MSLIDGVYDSHIHINCWENVGGYRFKMVESDYRVKSLSLIINSASCDSFYDKLSSRNVLIRSSDNEYSMRGPLLDQLLLSYIKGRKTKRDINQITIPIDFRIAEGGCYFNLPMNKSEVILITSQLSVNIQLRIKYHHATNIACDAGKYLFLDTFCYYHNHNRYNYSYKCPEFIAIYSNEDIDVLSVHYTLYDKNNKPIENTTCDNVMKKRIFGRLYNIISLGYQYSSMKDIIGDYTFNRCNEFYYVTIDDVVTLTTTTNEDIYTAAIMCRN